MSKWDRLFNWLNDMRLSITPDERVKDPQERQDRIIQVDLIDDIMEQMLQMEDMDD